MLVARSPDELEQSIEENVLAVFLLFWLALLRHEGGGHRLRGFGGWLLLALLLFGGLGVGGVLLSGGSFFFLWFFGTIGLFVLFGLFFGFWLLTVLFFAIFAFGLLSLGLGLLSLGLGCGRVSLRSLGGGLFVCLVLGVAFA